MRKFIFLFFFCMVFLPPVVFAQTTSSPEEQMILVTSEQPPLEASAAAVTQVDMTYFLPYPGLLPDNPLYFLKVARDRVIGFLIHDPLKKAEFNLLQADKRLGAGLILMQKDKTKEQLVYTTVLKGENYFDEAIMKTIEAKSQKMVINDFSAKLLKANFKHQEIIQVMQQRSSDLEKKKYDDLLIHMKQLKEKVNKNLLQSKAL